jgi:serine/threonine protein kinase
MPLADPIRGALGIDPDRARMVEAIAAIALTLAGLANEGIPHRDVKPDNLLCPDGVWSIGDFGLVKYPAGLALTEHGRKLGPTDFMAPEMRESPDTANPGPADVYSIAKTLWVLLAGVNLAFPGQHRADDDICRLTTALGSTGLPAATPLPACMLPD